MIPLVLLLAGPAHAVQPFHVENSIVAADVVALGRVVAVDAVAMETSAPRSRVSVRVTKVIRGRVQPDEVDIWFPDDGMTEKSMRGCVVNADMFAVGTKVLVYGHDTGDERTDLQACWAGTGVYLPVAAGLGKRFAIDQHGHGLMNGAAEGDPLERLDVFEPTSAAWASSTARSWAESAPVLTWRELVTRVRSVVPESERWLTRHGIPPLR